MANRKRYRSGRLVEIPSWLPKAMRHYRDANNLTTLDMANKIPVDEKGVRIGQHSIGALLNHDRKPEQSRVGSILLSHIVDLISDSGRVDWDKVIVDWAEFRRGPATGHKTIPGPPTGHKTKQPLNPTGGQLNFNGTDKKRDRSVAKLQLSIANLSKEDLELVWSLVDRLTEIDPRQKDVANRLLDLATMLEENGARQGV